MSVLTFFELFFVDFASLSSVFVIALFVEQFLNVHQNAHSLGRLFSCWLLDHSLWNYYFLLLLCLDHLFYLEFIN